MLNVVKMAKRLKRAETPLLDSAAARLVKKTADQILPNGLTLPTFTGNVFLMVINSE